MLASTGAADYLWRMRLARLTAEELAAIKRERPGVRASLACEGIELTPDEEALFVQFDRERLTPDQRQERILEYLRRRRPQRRDAVA